MREERKQREKNERTCSRPLSPKEGSGWVSRAAQYGILTVVVISEGSSVPQDSMEAFPGLLLGAHTPVHDWVDAKALAVVLGLTSLDRCAADQLACRPTREWGGRLKLCSGRSNCSGVEWGGSGGEEISSQFHHAPTPRTLMRVILARYHGQAEPGGNICA